MSDSNMAGEGDSIASHAAAVERMLKPIDFEKIQAAMIPAKFLHVSKEVNKAASAFAEITAPNIAKSLPKMNLLASLAVPDLSVLKQLEMPKIDVQYSSLAKQFERIRDLAAGLNANFEKLSQLRSSLESVAHAHTTPFEHLFFENRLSSLVDDLVGLNRFDIAEGLRRHHERHLIVAASLPQRGWYLTGDEPLGLTFSLAEAIECNDWERVDKEVMEHLPDFDEAKLRAALVEEGVSEHSINRLCKFLSHHRSGNYEEATFLGVPLIDELARCLYKGKDFTTKGRAKPKNGKMRPQIAMVSTDAPTLKQYHNDFVSDFGSLQHESEPTKLSDENYWNRHAIVHGLMKRPMGVKDSAKCLMAISFVLSAREEPKPNLEEEFNQIIAGTDKVR